MRQFDNEDDCKSHRSSLSACSSQQRLSIRNNLKKDTTDSSVIYEVEIFPKERVDTKDIIQVCSEANLVSLKARDEEAQQSYKLRFKEKKDAASKVEEILKHFEKLGTVKSSHSQPKEALSPIKTARKPSQDSNLKPISSPFYSQRQPSSTKSPVTPDWLKKQVSTNQ